MEIFYELLQQKKWSEILSKAKNEQASLKKNKSEWERICSILESEFIQYAQDEKPVLVSKLCFDYLKLSTADYIKLSDKCRLEIEDLGIKTFRSEGSSELLPFARICTFSKLAQDVVTSKSKNRNSNGSKASNTNMFPRTDWLNPLFKSEQESYFYQALKEVFSTYFIYPNVVLSNIFDKDKIFPHLDDGEQRFYFNGVVDFVVYDPSDGHTPKYFFEVDSFYHDRPEAKIRDAKKDAIFSAANIQLFRIRPRTDSLTTKVDFVSKINSLLRS